MTEPNAQYVDPLSHNAIPTYSVLFLQLKLFSSKTIVSVGLVEKKLLKKSAM